MVVGLLCLLGAGLAFVGAAHATHRRAQSAADLAALAGAQALQRGSAGCAESARVTSANEATLAECRVQGEEVWLTVTVPGPEWWGRAPTVTGRARAGPAPVPAPGTASG